MGKCKRITYAEVLHALTIANRKLSANIDALIAGTLPLQTKTVNANIAGQTVQPDEGFSLSEVVINPITKEYEIEPAEFSRHVEFSEPAKSVHVIGSGTIGKEEVSLTVTPSLDSAVYTPDENKTFKKVTVNAIDRIEAIKGTLEGGTYIFNEPVKGVEISEIMVDFTEEFLEKIYPVGSLYISTINQSPATFLGGTWSPLADKFLIGASNNFPAQSMGGAVSAKVTPSGTVDEHVLSVAELPSHSHNVQWSKNVEWAAGTPPQYAYNSSFAENQLYGDNISPTTETGSGEGHSHNFTGNEITVPTMPPYLSVYMWQRIA